MLKKKLVCYLGVWFMGKLKSSQIFQLMDMLIHQTLTYPLKTAGDPGSYSGAKKSLKSGNIVSSQWKCFSSIDAAVAS